MKQKKDIKKVLIIGSGPIIIGQACEFDYSGTQACKALRKLGYEIVLVNSNPATIMTDPEIADATYIEPLNINRLEQIIAKERPDALLPNLGGQSGLNLCSELSKAGILDKYNVEVIGVQVDAIERGEDRIEFKKTMDSLGIEMARSEVAYSVDEALAIADKLGYPVVLRPAYTMGGTGGGLVYNVDELKTVCTRGLQASLVGQVLVEESILGWEELELEVVRDAEGNMIPNLATEWDVNTDELSITWTLREGVNFADGEPFNAEAVKRNIEEYQANNRTETANIASCEVIDDTHIKMMMAEPNSSTLESVGFFVYYMSPKALENPSSLDAATCGTGPFQLSEFENNAYAIYTKNENYWKEGLPYLDSVEVTLVTESSTANTAFQANEYDMYWVGLANPTILQQLDGAGIYVKEDNQNGMGVESLGLIPNSAIDGPWADARVRRAIDAAVDKNAVVQVALNGQGSVSDSMLPECFPGVVTDGAPTYDPEKAKSLLAEAGYADGFTTNIITISGMSDMLTAIANMLDEVGIHCNIQQVDSATNNQYMKDGTWEGLMLHFATIAPDLGLYMGRHLDKNGAYYAKGIQHPDKEMELLEEIRRCMDPDEKHKLEKELQAAIYDAEDGSCLFGRVLYVNKSSMYKYDYVIDDHATEAFTACWDLSACWLNK